MKNNLAFRITLLLLLIALATYFFIHFNLHLFFKDSDKLIAFIKSYNPYDAIIFYSAANHTSGGGAHSGRTFRLYWRLSLRAPLGNNFLHNWFDLGSWAAFTLARFFGMPLLKKLISEDVFEKFEHFMEHKGMIVSFLLFLIRVFPKITCATSWVSAAFQPGHFGNFRGRSPYRHNNAFHNRQRCPQ